MSLTPEDAKNLREGDVILVPMVVSYANDHFDNPHGFKIVCSSSEMDTRMREEREKGPRRIEFMSRFVHSVARRPIKIDDWVEVGDESGVSGRGRVTFIDGQEVVVKRCMGGGKAVSHVIEVSHLSRIACPKDLTTNEKKVFFG